MTFQDITLAISTLTSVFLAILLWREYKLKQIKLPSEKDANLTAAIEKLAAALGLTSNELAESLVDVAKLRGELQQEQETTKSRIAETVKHREDMDQQVLDLKMQIEALNREYLKQIQVLRDENATLKRQFEELDEKYGKSKHVIEELLLALKKAGVKLPPGLSLLLGDSIKGWKWEE